MTLLNSRWSVVLAICVVILGSSIPLSAQFNIKLPKIPKVTKPSSPSGPTTTGSTTASAAGGSSSDSSSSKGRSTENLIPGGKIYFSTTPFTSSNAGARSNFTSADFIYGRLELNQSI